MEAIDILTNHSQMQCERSNWDSLAQDTADFFCPEYADIITTKTPGMPLNDKIFESKAGEALNMWVAINNFMLTPRNRQWHKLTAKNEDIREDPKMSAYLEAKTKNIFQKRYNPRANFASQVDKFYFSDGLFGNSILFVDSDDLINIRYRNIHPKEIYFKENHQGIIDYVHRIFTLTARQAVQKFGDKLPSKIKDDANDPIKKDNKHDFIHCVYPNDNYKLNLLDPLKKKFKSVYVAKNENIIISEGGYNVMPYIISRHQVALNEIYGRSPAMKILPSVKASNFMKKRIMGAADLAVSPIFISMNSVDIPPFIGMSGALNYGYISDNGTPAIQPLNTSGRIDYGFEMINDLRKDISTAFFMHIYDILIETPEMTATQVMQRTQEKAVILAPVIGAKQNDFLGVLIERELDIFNEMGMFDDMPKELIVEDGIGIEYDTEMTRMMRADEGVAINQTIQSVLSLAQADPGVLDIFDIPSVIREMSLINGVPAKLLRTQEEIEEINEKKQQIAQMQQVAQMASAAAPALKTANDAGLL